MAGHVNVDVMSPVGDHRERFGGLRGPCTSIKARCPVWYDDPRPCAVKPHNFADASQVDSAIDAFQRMPPGCFSLACALLAVTFAILIHHRYNHVLVVHRRVHTRGVSNTWWLIYFLMVTLESSFRIARVIFSLPGSTTDLGLFYTEMILRGIALAILCLALHYQIRYRSSPQWDGPAVKGASTVNGDADTKILLRSNVDASFEHEGYSRRPRVSYFVIGTGLTLNIVVLLVDAMTGIEPEVLEWVYLGSTWALLLILLRFAYVIVCAVSVDGDGPTFNDKLVLLIGVVLIVLSDSLPPSGWKWILPEGCELNVLAWYNLIEVFKIVGCVLFFVFMRQEYTRSKETCIHQTVGHIRQSTGGGKHSRY